MLLSGKGRKFLMVFESSELIYREDRGVIGVIGVIGIIGAVGLLQKHNPNNSPP